MTAQEKGRRYLGPVFVILGPTASGKTGVAIETALALEALGASGARGSGVSGVLGASGVRGASGVCGAEIISADSRAIYRGMDIGTAKPSLEEQRGVPHYGLDLVEPGERFTVADWKAYAEEKIGEIWGRGRVPMVVGGTGLYIDALVFDYQFGEQEKCSQSDRREMRANYVLIGIKTEPEVLRKRIIERANKLFVQPLYDETRRLAEKYNWSTQAMKSNIYQFAWAYLQGEMTKEEAIEKFIYDDWHLAKRQMTWFKRNTKINWLPLDKVQEFVIKCIQDE